MRVLITGVTGFVGSHLAEYCLSRGDVELFGTVRWRSRMDNLSQIPEGAMKLFDCDLKDTVAVRHCLAEAKPDYIFHLAAQSFVPTSWKAPVETVVTNLVSEINVFEAMRDLKLFDTKIQIAGSSEEYGMVYENEIPISETNPLRPLSPYGVSKVGQDLLGYQYHKSYGLQAIRTRAFNHTGPRRGEVFVSSNFAKQIAVIEKGKHEPVIYVGNLKAKRDFTDVRDMIRAYWLAAGKCEPGEVYNIGSGKAVTIREMLDILLKLSDVEIEVREDSSRMRPSDVMILEADATKFRRATGWEPGIPFEKTLEDLLNYWRERV
ncbi:MAG: GDP-mannose 4,6-dehydratase [Actinomycetota bacterium]|nr:GDP-mannose 4,6-dehydratase [Actinomycetota bacterium]